MLQQSQIQSVQTNFKFPQIIPMQKMPLNSSSELSFGIKKNQLGNLERAIVNRYKFQIDRFKTVEDFYDWMNIKVDELMKKNCVGPKIIERNQSVLKWKEFLISKYSMVVSFFVLDTIFQNIKDSRAAIPLSADKIVVEQTLKEIETGAESYKAKPKNFYDLYEKKLSSNFLADYPKAFTDEGEWIFIPSQKVSNEDCVKDIQKLRALAADTWCVKGVAARQYLRLNDFYIFVQNGKTKMAVVVEGGNVVNQIQDKKNNGFVSLENYDILKEFLKQKKFDLSEIRTTLNRIGLVKKFADKAKVELAQYFANGDYEHVFRYLGCKPYLNENNELILTEYKLPALLSPVDIGAPSLDKMFEKVVGIEKNADFVNSEIQNLSMLRFIGGDAIFSNSRIRKLENLEEIGGFAGFYNCQDVRLPKLRKIGAGMVLNSSRIRELPLLEEVVGDLNCCDSKIKALPKLKRVQGGVMFEQTPLENIESLEEITGDFVMTLCCQMKDISKLKKVGNKFSVWNCQDINLPALESVGGTFSFCDSGILNIPKLKYIGERAQLSGGHIKNAESLEIIGGDAALDGAFIETGMPNLVEVGGGLDLSNLNAEQKNEQCIQVTSLPRLKKIGKYLQLISTPITDFGSLVEVGGLYIYGKIPRIVYMPELQKVKNNIFKMIDVELITSGRITVDGDYVNLRKTKKC